MKCDKKVIENILPVTTDKAVYCDGTNNTINNYMHINTPKSKLVYNMPISPTPATNAFFSIVDDDCVMGSYTVLKPTLDELGIKAGWAVITSTVNTDGNMTIEQLKTLEKEGHEILSHTVNHSGGYVINDALIKEYKDSKSFLLSHGFDVKGIAYPGGGSVVVNRHIAGEYYNYAVSTNASINKIPINQMNINRVTFGKMWSGVENKYENYKALVDEIITNGGWLCFCTHARVDDSTQMQWLKDLVNYMKENNVFIGTPSQVLRYMGNAIEIEGKYVVTNSGEVYKNGVKQ